MTYKIFNVETDMYIGTTNNNNRDASKECCFENGILYRMYEMAKDSLDNVSFSNFCKHCSEYYTIIDDDDNWKDKVEAFKSVLKTKNAYSNFYSYFYLIPQKKKAADFYMIDIADNNARFPIPIAFFKTYQEAKEFVKNFKGDLKLSLSDIKEKEWTKF